MISLPRRSATFRTSPFLSARDQPERPLHFMRSGSRIAEPNCPAVDPPGIAPGCASMRTTAVTFHTSPYLWRWRHEKDLRLSPTVMLISDPPAGQEGVEPSSAVLEAALRACAPTRVEECPAARRQRPKPLIGFEPMSSSSASYRTRTGLNPWTGGLRRPSHHEAKSLLAASRTRPTRLGNACLGSARTRRWGEWPELNRASAVSQTALVTERVHPPQVRMGRIELPPRRPERRAQPMTLHPADSLRASTSNRTTFSGATSQRYHQTSSRRMLVTRRGYDPRLTV